MWSPRRCAPSIALAIAILTTDSACLAGDELGNGTHEIASVLQGERVTVVVQIADGRGCSDPLSGKWGVERTCPTHRVASLAVKRGNVDGFVPASAYSDITALRGIVVESTEGGFELTLHGGDAATSYLAVLRFSLENAKKVPILESRKVWGIDRDNPAEVFEYRGSIDGDY